mmetsp:Transcript_37262/g.97630  ORF Transcript_37262/g.97630 Transcript_37262/m.97630 type:complete len:232 (-) Transcript_37262:149-844(-)
MSCADLVSLGGQQHVHADDQGRDDGGEGHEAQEPEGSQGSVLVGGDQQHAAHSGCQRPAPIQCIGHRLNRVRQADHVVRGGKEEEDVQTPVSQRPCPGVNQTRQGIPVGDHLRHGLVHLAQQQGRIGVHRQASDQRPQREAHAHLREIPAQGQHPGPHDFRDHQARRRLPGGHVGALQLACFRPVLQEEAPGPLLLDHDRAGNSGPDLHQRPLNLRRHQRCPHRRATRVLV